MQVTKFSLTSHAETSNTALPARQAGKLNLSEPPPAGSRRLDSDKYNTAGGMNQWNKATSFRADVPAPVRKFPFFKTNGYAKIAATGFSPAEAARQPHLKHRRLKIWDI
jgi:hypothetical protein